MSVFFKMLSLCHCLYVQCLVLSNWQTTWQTLLELHVLVIHHEDETNSGLYINSNLFIKCVYVSMSGSHFVLQESSDTGKQFTVGVARFTRFMDIYFLVFLSFCMKNLSEFFVRHISLISYL